MTLKSIELNGFKSFGKKSDITFTAPITAIVGPNGSGKSNIVEAMRFVLGEQSIKSLRGKGGVDLIFKGSKNLSSSNRACVTITFDNRNKIFSFTSFANSQNGPSLDYDEIIIGREVFADGINRYLINGSEVRLKDIIDLLASVNIGSSGYHIISQGEADRALNASNKDRKSILEDALGLRIYQYRIREAERKLDKTLLNIKEIQSLRREIAPHLLFLKKQVQVVEKAREMREELRVLYKKYLSNESVYINIESKRLIHLRRILDEKSLALDERIENIKKNRNENEKENEYNKQIKNFENELFSLHNQKDEITRKFGRIEGILEGLERQYAEFPKEKEKIISESEWKIFIEELKQQIENAIIIEDLSSIIQILNKIKFQLEEFTLENFEEKKVLDINENIEYQELKKTKEEILKNLEKIREEESILRENLSGLKIKEQEFQLLLRDDERVLYDLLGQKNEVNSSLHSAHFEEEKLNLIKSAFENEIIEAKVLVGEEIMEYINTGQEEEINRFNQDELRKKIERIKIKLEDTGGGNAGDILKEYKDTEDRDIFLSKEINDLTKSVDSCRSLIEELKETLDKEFKEGVNKINKQFQEFFSLMFGGGSASLSITMEYKKPKKDNELSLMDDSLEEELDEEEGIELNFERGIEINVNLPHKKVKDLHMLSGGERSLTSIALLFAISQVNPPPFLVLDETDAALDEANSRKYGNIIKNLSKYSQLIVVTHNRETMSRANVLYGVTMSSEGVSKLLSIHLETATTYAK